MSEILLSDRDPMPFGTHRGKPMQDVPASYLLWLADQMGREPAGGLREAVRRYTDANRDCLELEVAEDER